jgi:hypothetical protein
LFSNLNKHYEHEKYADGFKYMNQINSQNRIARLGKDEILLLESIQSPLTRSARVKMPILVLTKNRLYSIKLHTFILELNFW